ncbi:MAG TPA: radical SAM protein, partial [Candidatus Omnitrophota bacterium]|nr:radical SAM protein [Candidatus Omnitrophota bacterium]
MKSIYGPVQSRRLGFSLGISLTPHKTCSFDCVYCQLGASARRTRERKPYVPVEDVLAELRAWLADNAALAGKLDYVTLSGSGEPVLHSGIGQIIAGIKALTAIPVCLITNSSLLVDAAVRKSILGADVIIPSLDAATQDIFERIDRPMPGIQ